MLGYYAWYNNDISWKDLYGGLYNWYAIDNSKGLCPTGWHVPTDDEWTALTDFIGGTGPPHGNELKSCRQVNSPLGDECNTTENPRWKAKDNQWGTDDYGFSGLPGGYRHDEDYFFSRNSVGFWWSSTEGSISQYGWYRFLDYYNGYVGKAELSKQRGRSVRCLKD